MASNQPPGGLSQPPAPAPFDLLSLVQNLGGDVLEVARLFEQVIQGITVHPLDILSTILDQLHHAGTILELFAGKSWEVISNATVGSFVTSFIDLGLEVDTSTLDHQAQKSLTTIDTVLGFCLIVQAVAAGLDGAGTGLLAGRWGKGVGQAISKIPEEMGLTWALGLTIEKLFDAALGEAAFEAIRKIKRPNQPEWPIIRTLLRQHLADEKFLKERLKAAGYPDDTNDLLLKLADAQIPVGDVQNLYLHGLIDGGQAKQLIRKLGFADKIQGDESSTDLDLLTSLYIDKAETEASRMYVSTARNLFRQQLMTEADYRALLASLDYPELEITDDVAAILLEQQTGRLQSSVSTIKSELLHHHINDSQAALELGLDGYGPAQANELIATWHLGPLPRQHTLGQSKILGYLVSGVLTPEQAGEKLAATGLDADDIALLLAHPTITGATRIRPLSPSLVVAAYVDGAIDDATLASKLAGLNLTADAVKYYEDTARYKRSRQKTPGSGTAPLTAAEIRDAWKYGLMDEHTAIAALGQLGYSSSNAELLLEITNKGLIQPPAPPAFPSVQAAIDYLKSQQYKVFAGLNPQIEAAIQMITQAGYTYQPPPVNQVPV